MKQFSIFYLLGFVGILAVLLAGIGSAMAVRYQSKEIAMLNKQLDADNKTHRHFVNALIQCQGGDRFQWVAPRLNAMAGTEFRVHDIHLELTSELEQITMLQISARVWDIETVETYGRKKLSETVLIIYNEDRNRVIDAMYTDDLGGGSRCSDGWELDIPNTPNTTVATPAGFTTSGQGDAG